ncbi:unnamed protein product [Prunus armeniaca]
MSFWTGLVSNCMILTGLANFCLNCSVSNKLRSSILPVLPKYLKKSEFSKLENNQKPFHLKGYRWSG